MIRHFKANKMEANKILSSYRAFFNFTERKLESRKITTMILEAQVLLERAQELITQPKDKVRF